MHRIIIATGNKHKLKEIKAILQGLPIKVVSLEGFSNVPEVVEDGKTLKENAVKKARTIALHLKSWALADDSGLEVEYLSGEPSVFSARWAGQGCTYEDNNKKLLSLLKNVERKKRKAQFKCVIALSNPKGRVKTVQGVVKGIITESLHGRHGFGYDPVFQPAGYDKTFAQLDPEIKNKISHRAVALQKAKKLIEKLQFETN